MRKNVLFNTNSFFLRTDKSVKKTQKRKKKRLKTLSDVKKTYKPSCLVSSVKKHSQRNSYNNYIQVYSSHKKPRASQKQPLKEIGEHFKVINPNLDDDFLEEFLHVEFFGFQPKESQISNLKIDFGSESREFIELQNQSIHVSKIFQSNVSRSITNSQWPLKSLVFDENTNCNKENCMSEEDKLFNMIKQFERSLKVSGINLEKKKLIHTNIKEIKSALGGEKVEDDTISFGKCLKRNRKKSRKGTKLMYN